MTNNQVLLGKSVWDWATLKKGSDPSTYIIDLSEALVKRYTYVTERDRFVDMITGRLLEDKQVDKLYYSICPRDEKRKVISATNIMLASHSLYRVADQTYRPGRPAFFEEDGEALVNSWMGLGLRPMKGDASIWVDHVKWICNDDPESYNAVFDALASMVQAPEKKLRRMILIIGKTRIGKDSILDPIKMILGRKNVRTPKKDTLMNKFNGWAEKCHLGICSEFRLTSEDEFERIKELATNDDLEIENKGKDHRQSRNYASLFAFSNHDLACPLPEDESRIHVIKSMVSRRDKAYYDRYRAWALSDDGAAIIMGWLMDRDLRNFSADAPAPMTEAKAEMQEFSINEHDGWLDMQLKSGAAPFRYDVVSVEAIVKEMRDQRESTNVKRVGQWLKRKGHLRLGQHSVGGTRPVVWAVRDHEFYKSAEPWQVQAAYIGASVEPKQDSDVIVLKDRRSAGQVIVDSPSTTEDEIYEMIRVAGARGDLAAIKYYTQALAKRALEAVTTTQHQDAS